MSRPLPGSLWSLCSLSFHIRHRAAVLCVPGKGAGTTYPSQWVSWVSAGAGPACSTAVPPDPPLAAALPPTRQRLMLSPSPRLYLKLNFLEENGVARSEDNQSCVGLGGAHHLSWSQPPPARLVGGGSGTRGLL